MDCSRSLFSVWQKWTLKSKQNPSVLQPTHTELCVATFLHSITSIRLKTPAHSQQDNLSMTGLQWTHRPDVKHFYMNNLAVNTTLLLGACCSTTWLIELHFSICPIIKHLTRASFCFLCSSKITGYRNEDVWFQKDKIKYGVLRSNTPSNQVFLRV